MSAVVMREVTRRFRNGRGLGPVSIEVTSGERVALMGPNGAGKTTLLRLLATADRPIAGSISWFDTPSRHDARRHIGYAPDTVIEEGALTARQATHFWCAQWLPRGFVHDAVAAALTTFGLGEVMDEPVSSFSFGMRRRLSLAQAISHEPRLLLLDEPTAGLDPEGVDTLQRVLRDSAARGLITVLAGNDCTVVAAACDRVVFIDGGCVVRDASPQALLAEVDAARRAELRVVGRVDLAALRALPGVGDVSRVDGVVSVELLDGAALSTVVAAADGGAGTLRGLTVHTPDLSDSFRHITGRPLADAEARS